MFQNKQVTLKTNDMEVNVVAKNTLITGEITSEGDFRIDGDFEGNIKTKGRIIIGLGGSIKGKIDAVNSDIEGSFEGELVVHEVLTVKSTAQISGDVVIGKLSVEPGASFNASCAMKDAGKGPKKDSSYGKKKDSEKTS